MNWKTLLGIVLLPIPLVIALPNPQDSESLPTLTFSTAVASPSNPSSTLPSQIPVPPTQPWCPSQIFCPGAVSAAYTSWYDVTDAFNSNNLPAAAPSNCQYRSTVL